MAGDPSKATVWPCADVYVAPLDATPPADVDAPFAAAWNLVGLLDGDEGFVFSRDEDTNDLFAWCGILVRTTRRQFKQTIQFTALEDNETTRELIWPGSDPGEIVVPRPVRQKVALEVREDERIKRWITAYEAEIALSDDITEQEADMTRYQFQATIFPDADGVLLLAQENLGGP